MTISLPWNKEQADYVADLLRDRAQSRVDLARDIGGGSLVKGFKADLATNAIMIEGLVTDLRSAEVTNERGEDDLAGTTDGHGPDDSPDSGGGDA